MTEMLQGDRNASVNLEAMEQGSMAAIAAAKKQDTETPIAAPSSKFAAPSEPSTGDSGVIAEVAMHGAAMALGPAALLATTAASIGWQAYKASNPKGQKKNSMFSQDSKATHKNTITPGLRTGGKQNFAGAKVTKTASSAFKAKQANGEMAGSIFMTRQSVQSLNDNKMTKGLNTTAAKPAALATAIHLANLGHIRRSQAQGPKIVADSRIVSHETYEAARKGNDAVLDRLGDHAPDAKVITQKPAQPTGPTPPSEKNR
jgi:hypothetical protein